MSMPPEPKAEDRVGTVIGQRYELVSILGEGGMAVVFLAKDRREGDRRVALKILKREVANDPLVLARFEREAIAMQNLAHEHIVAPLGFGQSPEGDMCLVMEHLDGETLRTKLKRERQLQSAEAIEIIRQVALGLARAHDLGVVHRDLKSDNILLSTRGGRKDFVKILDFGLAALAHDPRLAPKGAVFGTPDSGTSACSSASHCDASGA